MVAAPPVIPRRAVSTARVRHRPPRRRWLAWFVLVLILIGGLGVTVFVSPLFAVRGISVEGIDGEALDAARGYLMERVAGTNLLLLDTGALRAAVGDALPELETVSVVRVWPRDVAVEFKRRVSSGTWCRATEAGRPCYYFDRSGATWGQALPSSGTLLVTVIDERPEGDLQMELLDDILMLSDGIRALDIAVRQVGVQSGPLHVVTFESTDGVEVRFSRIGDLGEQLEVFQAFLSERRSTETVPTGYMDMTVPGKVYFQ